MKHINITLTHVPIDWRSLAPLWGELSYWHCRGKIDMVKIAELDRRINLKFTEYILASYDALFYESYFKRPATIDKVLPFLACQPESKTALLCMDGMCFQDRDIPTGPFLRQKQAQRAGGRGKGIFPICPSELARIPVSRGVYQY